MMWGLGGAGYFWMLLVWIAIPATFIWAWRGERRDRRPEDRAIEILNERFASGEVDQTEFEIRRAELTR